MNANDEDRPSRQDDVDPVEMQPRKAEAARELTAVQQTLVDSITAFNRKSERSSWRVEILTWAMLLLAAAQVFAAYVAFQYARSLGEQQIASEAEQGKILAAQREALDASRRALEQVVQASERSRSALEAQLALTERQQALEAARLAQRPKIEVDFATAKGTRLNTGERVAIDLTDNRAALDVTVRNIGDAVLTRPVLIFDAQPPNVTVAPKQTASTIDFVPTTTFAPGYRHRVTLTVPADVTNFEVRVTVFGDNLPRESRVVPFRAVR